MRAENTVRGQGTLLFCEHHFPGGFRTFHKQTQAVQCPPSARPAAHIASLTPVGGTAELTPPPGEQRSKQLCFSQTGLDFCLKAFGLNGDSDTV